MNPHFLFPASPLDGRMIDPDFQDQAIALKLAGFSTSVLTDDMKLIGDLRTAPEDTVVVYRGWMMDTEGYQNYTDTLLRRPLKPLTSPEQYVATHHFPNWYPLLERYTPESVSFGNSLETPERVYNFALGAFAATSGMKLQIKDYVKSLKTAGGSVVSSADEIKEVLANMEKFRGTIEGGIVLRKFEEFYPGSEVRYFVINGKFYGQNSMFDLRHMNILDLMSRSVPSPFYSVDIALRVDGVARIIEVGDGQVSDLVGWTPDRFAEIWKQQ
jgi:ATP-grasp domain, R2K clade family 3